MGPPCCGGINVPTRRVRGSAKQGVDEGGRLERRQIVGTFTKSDQLHRHPELLLDAENDAALGRSIEFGQHRTGDVHYIGEHPGLRQPVLPDGRVEYQQHLDSSKENYRTAGQGGVLRCGIFSVTAADRRFLDRRSPSCLRSPDDRSSRSSPDRRFSEFGCLASCLAPFLLVNGGRADRVRGGGRERQAERTGAATALRSVLAAGEQGDEGVGCFGQVIEYCAAFVCTG